MSNIGMIVACSPEGGIGYQGKLPWRLPGDLKRFKELTMGNVVIMGRKTYESLPGPLEGRHVIVMTSDMRTFLAGKPSNVSAAYDVKSALLLAKSFKTDRIYIAGGGEIYKLFKEYIEFAYVTISHVKAEYDTYLETIPTGGELGWNEPDPPVFVYTDQSRSSISHEYRVFVKDTQVN